LRPADGTPPELGAAEPSPHATSTALQKQRNGLVVSMQKDLDLTLREDTGARQRTTATL
jgi:hypothetical protein